MVRSFVFSKGKLLSQDPDLDFMNVVLHGDDVQVWVDLEKPTPEETHSLLEEIFRFHPLAIEDCVTVSERPKVEDYGDYLFLVLHAVDFSRLEHEFCTNELNLFIGKNYLVTYHDDTLRSVNATVDRITRSTATIARAPDRLTYYLLELLLENYDPALEELSEAIAELEQKIIATPLDDVMPELLSLKKQVQRLRQISSPQREVIGRLARGEFKLVHAHLLPYYRDLQDRLMRISDLAENYRDALNNILQMHLSLQQNEANKVIKVLTVLATLAIPILVVTSYYGMNIRQFPNTSWPPAPYAHGFIWSVIGLCTVIIYGLLKRKHWL